MVIQHFSYKTKECFELYENLATVQKTNLLGRNILKIAFRFNFKVAEKILMNLLYIAEFLAV